MCGIGGRWGMLAVSQILLRRLLLLPQSYVRKGIFFGSSAHKLDAHSQRASPQGRRLIEAYEALFVIG
jgi:hypothetical protein